MRLEFDLELHDAPGALAPVLQAVADHGGNVHGILHQHAHAEGRNVPVSFTIEIPEADAFRLMDRLARGHRILRVGQQGGPASHVLLLSGPILDAGLDGLLGQVWHEGAEVERVELRVGAQGDGGAAFLRLRADAPDVLGRAIGALTTAANDAGLRVLDACREDA